MRLTKTNDTLSTLPTYNVTGGTFIGAATPLSPAGLSRGDILIIGLLLGLMAGIAVAFLLDTLDDGLRDAAMLESKLGAPTLATLPRNVYGRRQGPQGGLDTVVAPSSAAADRFRTLRTMLTSVGAGGGVVLHRCGRSRCQHLGQ